MRKHKRVLSVLVLAAPLAATAGERLHVIEHAVNETTTHVAPGAKGDSVGDLLTFANPVFDATNKTQLGTDHGWCVRVAVGKSWECFWTLLLKEGRICAQGSAPEVLERERERLIKRLEGTA